VRNEASWLWSVVRALDSQSTNRSIKILILDNQSTDYPVLGLSSKHQLICDNYAEARYRPGKAINYCVQSVETEYTIILSGHCVPTTKNWLESLIKPMTDFPDVVATYGAQLPLDCTSDDDSRDMLLKFGAESVVQKTDGFIHNANAAYLTSELKNNLFDEEADHLEDYIWGRNCVQRSKFIAYVPEASVFHFHGLHQHGKARSFRSRGVNAVLRELHFSKSICAGQKPAWMFPNDCEVAMLVYGPPNARDLKLDAMYHSIHDLLQLRNFDRYFIHSQALQSEPLRSINLNLRHFHVPMNRDTSFELFIARAAREILTREGKTYAAFILVDLGYQYCIPDVFNKNFSKVFEEGYESSFASAESSGIIVRQDDRDSEEGYFRLEDASGASRSVDHKILFGQFGVVRRSQILSGKLISNDRFVISEKCPGFYGNRVRV
jgi:GT2 family glycosyltransferase